MATASKRDVTLGVGIETTGAEGLTRLADQVRRLGAEGGPAAAKFDALADQIDRLAGQAGQVDNLRRLTAEVDALAAQQAEAAAATTRANEALKAQAAVAAAARTNQSALSEGVLAARNAWREANDAVKTLRDTTDAAGRKTAEYTAQMGAARVVVREKATALDQAKSALSGYGQIVAAAINEETRLAAATTKAADALQAATRSVGLRQSALQSTQAALIAAGAATTELAQAEADLLETQQRLVAEAQSEAAAHRESVTAMQQLEAAARGADTAYALLVASLKETQAAATQYASAMDRVVVSSEGETSALRERQTAAQALLASDSRLTAEQRDLASSLDLTRNALLAEAQAMLAQQRAAEASIQATARLVSQSQAAGRVLNDAFGTVGVRSLNAIETETIAVERAMSLMERQFRAGAISAQDLARGVGAATVKLNQLQVEARQVQALPGAFERVNGTITGLINRFGALSAAVATVGLAAKPAIDAFIALDQTTRVLTTITGSAKSAAEQVEFLRQSAQRNGQSFDTLASAYSKFAASALQTGLSLDTVQSTFDAVANAAGNLGLSSDQTKRALEALGQIASKGTVQMEELRQQLGDALPGVLPLLAKRLGLTTSELIKLVETGGLAAREGIPAVRDALLELGTKGGAEVKGLTQEWNRFTSALSEGATIIGQGSVGQALGYLAAGLAKVAGLAVLTAAGVAELFTVVGTGAGALVGTLVGGGGLGDALKNVQDIANGSNERLERLAARFGLTGKAAADSASDIGRVGEAATAASGSFAKLLISQAEATTAAENAARVAEKQSQALNTIVTEAENLSKSYVDQAAGLQVVIDAQGQYVEGLQSQLSADRALLESLQASKDALTAKIGSDKQLTDAYKEQIKALDEKIAKADADAAKTEASVRSEAAKTAALKTSKLALEDHSKEYGKLLKAVEAAERGLAEVNDRVKQGRAAYGEAERAAKTLRDAKVRLKDAANDLSDALDRQVKLMESEVAITKANIQLTIEKLRTQLAESEYQKNDYQSRQLRVKILEAENRLQGIGNKLKSDTAQITLKAVQTERQALASQGLLTEAKRQELQARENVARASIVEAQAAAESVKGKQFEVKTLEVAAGLRDQLAGGIGETTERYRADTAETERNTDAQVENTKATNARAAATKRLSDSQGGLSAGSKTPSASVLGANKLTLPDFATGGGVAPPDSSGDWVFDAAAFNAAAASSSGAGMSAEQAKRFWVLKPEAATRIETERLAGIETARAGNVGGRAGTSIFDSVATRQAASASSVDPFSTSRSAVADEALVIQGAQSASVVRGLGDLAQQLTAFTQALNNTAQGSQAATTVNITLDGRTSSIPTTEAGAQALIALLQRAQLTGGG